MSRPPTRAPASSSHATATMKANRRRDTSPELALRSALHRTGLRYRVDDRIEVEGRPVRPDVVFRGPRVAVFIDGCFWHGCPEHGEVPVRNRAFWLEKLRRNAERDAKQTQLLEAAGWAVIRIWEHEPVPEAVANIRGLVHRRTTR